MTPEEQARKQIDRLLTQAGWAVQSMDEVDRYASVGVAVREFRLSTGYADYMLFVDGDAAGVSEAKPGRAALHPPVACGSRAGENATTSM